MDNLIQIILANKTVTIPQNNITIGSWAGTAYTALDPDTGAGAYMISGGRAGDFLELLPEFQGMIVLDSKALLCSAPDTCSMNYGRLQAVADINYRAINAYSGLKGISSLPLTSLVKHELVEGCA